MEGQYSMSAANIAPFSCTVAVPRPGETAGGFCVVANPDGRCVVLPIVPTGGAGFDERVEKYMGAPMATLTRLVGDRSTVISHRTGDPNRAAYTFLLEMDGDLAVRKCPLGRVLIAGVVGLTMSELAARAVKGGIGAWVGRVDEPVVVRRPDRILPSVVGVAPKFEQDFIAPTVSRMSFGDALYGHIHGGLPDGFFF
jgi:hypothetical protein